jgi:multidrug efflux pump subunit AcrA (membrane-fusion protein)
VNYYQVNSKIPGIVDSIYVTAGQNVNPGSPLLKIQSQTNQLSLQTAENLYKLARTNAAEGSDLLITLEQKIKTAYETYQQDSVDYERFKYLNAQNIGSQQVYEQALLRFQISKSNYILALSNLQGTRDRLQTELKNARNNFLAQKSQLGDYLLLATISGKVYDIIPAVGEMVSTNRPVIELGAADSFEVEMLVDETDIILIKIDQPVVYALDALEDTVFHGRVKKIYPRINPSDKTAKVLASIDSGDYALYPGMSLEANIVIREKQGILVIPVEYLAMDRTVIVKRGSKKESLKVTTGIRDLKYVEILSGLEENDHILKP